MKASRQSPEAGSGETDTQAAAEDRLAHLLADEYRALDESLREYLDGRLARLQAPAPPQTMSAAAAGSGRAPWRVDLYFAITVLALGLLWWRLESQIAPATDSVSRPVPAEGGDAPAAAQDPPRDGIAPRRAADGAAPGSTATGSTATGSTATGSTATGSTATGSTAPAAVADGAPILDLTDPGRSWESYVRRDPEVVAQWLTAISEARGLDAGQVSDRQKSNFSRWAKTLRSTGSLTASEMGSIRTGLFEYIYGLWVVGRQNAGAPRLDLVISEGEYSQQQLASLLQHLALTHLSSEPVDPATAMLQLAVVVTKIADGSPTGPPRSGDG